MRMIPVLLISLQVWCLSCAQPSGTEAMTRSQDLLRAQKMGNDKQVKDLLAYFSALDPAELSLSLPSREARIAFWLNLYNTCVQIRLSDTLLFHDPQKFFREAVFRVAGKALSLDEIENGMLRHEKFHCGAFTEKMCEAENWHKQLWVTTPDYRIHFALNCGAKSCPPVASYSPEKLDEELDAATLNYLQQDVIWDSTQHVVILPMIFQWYGDDFGGRKGILGILKKYGIIPNDAQPDFRYSEYDWTADPRNYRN